MKCTVLLALMVFGVMTGLCVAADKGEASSPKLEDLAWLIGQWEGEYVMPEGFPEVGPAGAKVVTFNSFQSTLGNKYMSLKIRDQIDGKLFATGDELIGFDNVAGKLGHWFFGSKGFHGSGHWSRTGDVWSITWQSFEPDGKKIEGVSNHVQIDADTFTWQMVDLKENGKEIGDWPKVTYRRKLAAAPDEDELWQAYLAAAAGTWDGEGSLIRDMPDLGIAKGDKFKMRFALEPDLDGKALLGKTKFEMLDKPFTAECRVLAGWDPASRQVRFLAMWSGGLVEEIVLAQKRGTKFLGSYTAKSPSTSTLKARIRLDFPTPDSYVWTFLDGPHKGKTLSSWIRVK